MSEIVPTFSLRGKTLYCDNKPYVHLQNRPLTMKLIKAFCDHPTGNIKKSDLIRIIYDSFEPQDKSPRFKRVLGHNVTKLVSRARILLEKNFNSQGSWIEFFVYDTNNEQWGFYRLKNEYIVHREKKINATG